MTEIKIEHYARIELTHDDIEQILVEWADAKFKKIGYRIDYTRRESGEFHPDVLLRGVKDD